MNEAQGKNAKSSRIKYAVCLYACLLKLNGISGAKEIYKMCGACMNTHKFLVACHVLLSYVMDFLKKNRFFSRCFRLVKNHPLPIYSYFNSISNVRII